MTPYGAKHPCAHPMCTALVHGRYCERHKPAPRKDTRHRTKRHYDTSKWREQTRPYVLALSPYCAICGKPFMCAEADIHIDHIIPLDQGGTDDLDNLQAVHQACHSTKTAKEKRKK
jgi:5-methylcytosine-specific restriction enzyme A